MAINTRLISGGTTYYLAGGGASQVPYAGSLTPWTVQTTTPFELSLNDTTGPIYTPAPAPSVPILGGGPPFRMGRSLIAKSYDVVTEPVGIQLRATSHDNAVALLRILRQALNTTLFDSPCILAAQPDGATNTTYFEILYADVPEKPDYIWESASGKFIFRAVITWVRTIGSAGTLTTLINGVPIQNRSSGSPDNVESLGTPVGDLIYEGQPLNLLLDPSATVDRVYLATVYERINTSVTSTKTTTTTNNFTSASATVTNARNRVGLKLRILARFDTITAPSKVRLTASILDATGGYTIKNLPQQALPTTTSVSALMDFGFVDVSTLRSTQSATLGIMISIVLASSDGTSVTVRLDYVETLLYYTFATIPDANTGGSDAIYIEQTNDYNVNSVVTPNTRPRVYRVSPTNWKGSIAYRGQLPRAISGASLYLGWMTATSVANDTHTTTDTFTTTATHLPLAHTLR
jgi:hypothetical protein